MDAENALVFDAGAVVAFLDSEVGANVVETLLESADQRRTIHLINVCEVYYHVYRSAGAARAGQLEARLEGLGLILDGTLSSELWQTAGQLKAEWRRVSLADCFAVALTLQKGGTLVTCDHHELDPLAEAGVCPMLFIR